jgi:GIY-YIG catalytic domain
MPVISKLLKQIKRINLHLWPERTVSFIVKPDIYFNSQLDKYKAIKQNINRSGVYRWTNRVNNKTYIGSSICRRFKEYYNYNHISNAKRNFPIHNALLKYGYSKFKLEILEYCVIFNLIEREQY